KSGSGVCRCASIWQSLFRNTYWRDCAAIPQSCDLYRTTAAQIRNTSDVGRPIKARRTLRLKSLHLESLPDKPCEHRIHGDIGIIETEARCYQLTKEGRGETMIEIGLPACEAKPMCAEGGWTDQSIATICIVERENITQQGLRFVEFERTAVRADVQGSAVL